MLEISRMTDVPYSTVRNWCSGRNRQLAMAGEACPDCGQRCLPLAKRARPAYAYLLGQYLGDGGIYRHRRSVFRLVIFGDDRYETIARDTADAMRTVMPLVSVNHQRRGPARTCLTTYSYSKSWPCLFPQHGSGPKHERPIVLDHWQAEITTRHPDQLIRGLIHSDGCRSINTVFSASGKRYQYPRYQFSNRSDDIRRIFCDHLDLLGIPWRRMNRFNISVARRDGVARLDEFVGPKS